MAKQKGKGDVYYFRFNKKGERMKRPIAYSTSATSDLLGTLSKDCKNHYELMKKINYDDDAKAIVQTYIDLGYGDDKPLFRY